MSTRNQKSKSQSNVKSFVDSDTILTSYIIPPAIRFTEEQLNVRRYEPKYLMPYLKYLIDYYNPVDEFWEKQRFFDFLYLVSIKQQCERRACFTSFPIAKETGPYFPDYDLVWDIEMATEYPEHLSRKDDHSIKAFVQSCHLLTEEELHTCVMYDSIFSNPENFNRELNYVDLYSRRSSFMVLDKDLQKYYTERNKIKQNN